MTARQPPTMHDIKEQNKGKVYAVARGTNGFGLFDDWATAGCTGCSGGAAFKTFEYNHLTPTAHRSERKLGSYEEARSAALTYLLGQCVGAEREAVQAVLDAEYAAAARAQQERDEREWRDECERRAAAEQRAAERAQRAAEQERAAAAAAVEQREREQQAAKRQAEADAKAAAAAAEAAAARTAAAAEAARRQAAEKMVAEREVAKQAAAEQAAVERAAAEKAAAAKAAEAQAAAAEVAAAAQAAAAAAQAAAAEAAATAQTAAALDTLIDACLDSLLHEWAPEAMATWRNQPDGARSAAAKVRRRAKRKAQRSARTAAEAQPPAATAAPSDEALGAPTLHECELRRALARSEALVRLERKRTRREVRTALHRGKQAERRNGKAAARKKRAAHWRDVDRATLKDSERARRGKRPAGEPLHGGELKHRRLMGDGGSHSYRTPTPPATTSRPRSVPHGVDPSPRLTFAL